MDGSLLIFFLLFFLQQFSAHKYAHDAAHHKPACPSGTVTEAMQTLDIGVEVLVHSNFVGIELQIGQININIRVDKGEGRNLLVAARIVHDGDFWTVNFKRLDEIGDEMPCGDEGYIVRALIF